MSIEEIFGTGRDLNAWQMSARAFGLFFVMLVLVRVTGMRAFGRKSSFDTVIVITLGALLSRVIVAASPALPTIAAAAVLCVLHRVIAVATSASRPLERLVKGDQCIVYRRGEFDWAAMRTAGMSRADLEEAVRSRTNKAALDETVEIHLESSGDLTVVRA